MTCCLQCFGIDNLHAFVAWCEMDYIVFDADDMDEKDRSEQREINKTERIERDKQDGEIQEKNIINISR